MALCAWCASWERVATSGEKGNCLDPDNPAYQPPKCGHPPNYWPIGRPGKSDTGGWTG